MPATAASLVLRAIRVGPALILLLLCLILTLVTPFFLTGDNLTNLLVQGAPLARWRSVSCS